MTNTTKPQLDVSQIRMDMAQVIEFHIKQPLQPISLGDKQFRVSQNFQIMQVTDDDKIGVRGIFLIELMDGTDTVLSTCKADLIFGFVFPDLKSFINVGPPPSMDAALQLSLLTLVYSTARGMIAVQAKGTLFERAFLPVLPPSALLPPLKGESKL